MRITVVCVVFSLYFVSVAQSAEAETIECGTGDVLCLITAIHQANTNPSKTIIRLEGGIYLLTTIDNFTGNFEPNGLPSIASPVKIEGGNTGATIARAADAPTFRFFYVGPTEVSR